MENQDKFQRKTKVEFEEKGFQVKTLESLQEIERLFEFRKRIFRDVGYISDNRQLSTFDLVADHLAVIDKYSGNFIASYILVSSKNSNVFGCDKRWVFDELKNSNFDILELAWLCVDSIYITKRIWLLLLLRGVREYTITSGEHYYFGSASIPTNDLESISQIYFYLNKEKLTSDKFNVYPKETVNLIKVSEDTYWGDDAVKRLIPKLFFWYFKLGGKAAKQPIILSHVNRTDFFMYGETQFAIHRYTDLIRR
jgi:putative hemolysin